MIVGLEVERELPRRGLRRVGSVNEVRRDPERQVAPNGAGSGQLGVGRADHQPGHRDRRAPLEGDRDDRPGREMLDQRGVERLTLVLGVVPLSELRRHPNGLRGDDLEPLSLEPSDDLPHHSPPHAVGLHEDERALDVPLCHRLDEPTRRVKLSRRPESRPLHPDRFVRGVSPRRGSVIGLDLAGSPGRGPDSAGSGRGSRPGPRRWRATRRSWMRCAPPGRASSRSTLR